MKADQVRAGLREVRHDAVDGAYHQMHVDGHLHVRADRLAYERANRQVRHVVVVHHVEVNPVGARGYDVADFFAEPREVGGQNAGSDTELSHGVGWAGDGKPLF